MSIKSSSICAKRKTRKDLLFNNRKDFEHLRKWNFCKTFSLKTSLPLIVYNFEKMSQLVLSTNRHYSSHTKSHAELIVFIHILITVFGLQKKSLFLDNFLMQKLINHLFLVTFFLEHFLHRCTFVQFYFLSRG